MTISPENDRLTIIIPKVLKEQLKVIADHHNRSLSNYIVNVLNRHILKETDDLAMWGHFDTVNKFNEIEKEHNKEEAMPRTQGREMGKQGSPRESVKKPNQEENNPYYVEIDDHENTKKYQRNKKKVVFTDDDFDIDFD